MTLNDHSALKFVSGSAYNELAFMAFGQLFENLKSYLYSVSDKIVAQGTYTSKVRFIWIFAGVRWRGASDECGVVVNRDFRFFRSLYLPNLHIHGHNYYSVLCSPLVALQ